MILVAGDMHLVLSSQVWARDFALRILHSDNSKRSVKLSFIFANFFWDVILASALYDISHQDGSRMNRPSQTPYPDGGRCGPGTDQDRSAKRWTGPMVCLSPFFLARLKAEQAPKRGKRCCRGICCYQGQKPDLHSGPKALMFGS